MTDATSAQVAAQVPFWLQMTSIALAPVLGFVGVAIGALLTQRSQRWAYIQDQRRKAYLKHSELLQQLTDLYGFAMKQATEEKDIAKLSEQRAAAKALEEKLQRSFLAIRIVGSSSAIATATRMLTYQTLYRALETESRHLEFNEEAWANLGTVGWEMKFAFTRVARHDLGLRGRENLLQEESSDPRDDFTMDLDSAIQSLSRTLNEMSSSEIENESEQDARPG